MMPKITGLIFLFLILSCGRAKPLEAHSSLLSIKNQEFKNRNSTNECNTLREYALQNNLSYNGKEIDDTLFRNLVKKDLIPIVTLNSSDDIEWTSIVHCSQYYLYYVDLYDYFNKTDTYLQYYNSVKTIEDTSITYVTKNIAKKSSEQVSNGKNVLLLDSGPISVGPYINRDNMLAMFKTDPLTGTWYIANTQYQSSNRVELLINLLCSINVLWSNAKLLTLIKNILFKDIKKEEAYDGISHFSTVFNLLVSTSPSARIVTNTFPSDVSPLFLNYEKSKNAIELFYENYFQSLKKIIYEYKISYINISQTPDKRTLAFFNNDIKKYNLNAEYMTSFIKRIANELPVIVLWAMPNTLESEVKRGNNKKFFCDNIPNNLLRIGYMSDQKFFPNAIGEKINTSYLDRYQKNISECTDIYINGNIDEEKYEKNSIMQIRGGIIPIKYKWWNEHSVFISYKGLISPLGDIMATSWATPLALSFVMNYFDDNQTEYSRKENNMTKKINLLMSLKGRMFDPFKNKQFEVYKNHI